MYGGGDGFFPRLRWVQENVQPLIPHLCFFFFYFLKVEISSCTLIPLFRPGSVHRGSVSWVLPDKLHVSSFPECVSSTLNGSKVTMTWLHSHTAGTHTLPRAKAKLSQYNLVLQHILNFMYLLHPIPIHYPPPTHPHKACSDIHTIVQLWRRSLYCWLEVTTFWHSLTNSLLQTL